MPFFYSILILVATCSDASAYIDPGSGAFVWQVLCAAIVGLLFQAKKVASFFLKLFKKNDD